MACLREPTRQAHRRIRGRSLKLDLKINIWTSKKIYDPYGAHATATALNGALPVNPWRYDSAYLDLSGLYHLGARYYDPTTGRFTQQDPASSPAGGNLYTYAGGNPVNNSDPGGTDVQGTQQDPVPGETPRNLQYTGLEPGASPAHRKSGSFFGRLAHTVTHAVGSFVSGCLNGFVRIRGALSGFALFDAGFVAADSIDLGAAAAAGTAAAAAEAGAAVVSVGAVASGVVAVVAIGTACAVGNS